MKNHLLIPILLAGLVLGCNNSSQNSQNKVYVGGRIENPTSDYFILSKHNAVVDTLVLDSQNEFGKTLKNIEPGIYNFNHPPENQLIYLEPGDSVLVWLNTYEFDESINFSGKGAKKSTFLLDMFLLNEKNNDLILSYYKIQPAEFAKLTDSIFEERKSKLRKLKKEKEFSRDFLDIAEASIAYEYYHLRERYTFLIKKYYPELSSQIPTDFHAYRKDLDFNKKELQNYYGYMNFIDDYLRTRSIERCEERFNPSPQCYSTNNFDNIRYRLKLADSLIQNQDIKATFIDRLAAQGIIHSSNVEDINGTLRTLEEIDVQTDNLEAIRQMAKVQKRLLPGNNIGHLELTNVDGDTIKLGKLSQNPIITYHWSLSAPNHFRWQHDIIASLRKKYPEISFIGINIDEGVFKAWQQTLQTNSFNPAFEFQLTSWNVDGDLLKNYLNKLFFIDPSGTIINVEAQLNSPAFEREILEFLNEV